MDTMLDGARSSSRKAVSEKDRAGSRTRRIIGLFALHPPGSLLLDLSHQVALPPSSPSHRHNHDHVIGTYVRSLSEGSPAW